MGWPSVSQRPMTALPIHTNGKKHLPQPRGPHSVGFVDIMTPGNEREGILVRMYFPTTEQCLHEHSRWPLWADDHYVSGLLTFMKAMLHRWPSWAQKGEYLHIDKLKYLSPCIPYMGFPALFRMLNGHVYTPIIENAALDKSRKWPLIIFSHGLGCARFTYSQICYDLASFGFLVIAPEHREGSACLSFHGIGKDRHWIPHRRVHHHEDEYMIRNTQVHLRSDEVIRALNLAFSLNEGQLIDNELDDYTFDLSVFKDAIDLSKPVMSGHSFGGATTLLTLAKEPRFKIGIALDAWLFPLKDEELTQKVKQPIMFVNTESFLHPDNLEKMDTFNNSVENVERICHCIKGSVHQNHIDAPFVFQKTIMKRMLGMHSDTCPDVVMCLNNKMMVQFVRKHLGLTADKEIDSDIAKASHLLKTGFGSLHQAP